MPLPDLRLPPDFGTAQRRAALLTRFADEVYGQASIAISPHVLVEPIDGTSADRIVISLRHGNREMEVDAALWRPSKVPVKSVIVVLDFLGPVGCMTATFPIDEAAVIQPPMSFGKLDRITEAMRASTAHRIPVEMLMQAGHAVLVSCYGSWTPDCPRRWREHGTARVVSDTGGAISLWAWAYRRLVDVAEALLDARQIILAGHSRLGKAALWAAAQDDRVDAVFANQSGCFGAAPHAHPVGESAAQLIERFPHWLNGRAAPALDQHLLLALIAPRKVYLGQAKDDIWADPLGSIHALECAKPAWGERKDAIGHHLREGGHDLLPEDWQAFLAFLGR